MSPRLPAVFLASIALAACGEPPSAASTASAAGASNAPAKTSSATPTTRPSAAPIASPAPSVSSAPSVPPPFDGKRATIAQVMYAGNLVHGFDAWDEAMTKLEAAVGKATETHDDEWCWAAEEGDRCAYFCIQKTTFEKLKRDKKGPAVGSKDNPQSFGPDGPSGNLELCHKYLGKK